MKIREFEGPFKTKEVDKKREQAVRYIKDCLYLC